MLKTVPCLCHQDISDGKKLIQQSMSAQYEKSAKSGRLHTKQQAHSSTLNWQVLRQKQLPMEDTTYSCGNQSCRPMSLDLD